MNGQTRKNIYPGLLVDIVLKADQPTGKLTRGTVQQLLTSSPVHPRGIKVRLTTGQVGRVQHIVDFDSTEVNPLPKKKAPQKIIELPASSTFSELFQILNTLDPTKKYSRFYKKLDEHFTPNIVDDIYDFQHDERQEHLAKSIVVLTYFEQKGFDQQTLEKNLSLKFLQ